jgi:hypothetical protein
MVQARQGAVEINDFDVYTTLSKFREFIHFFTEIEGYKVIGDFYRPPPGPYNTSGIAKLFRLQKGAQNVDIIVTNLSSAVLPIFQFHNTVVMNFISAEAVFCAYPRWMLGMVGLVHPRMYKQNATNFATIKGLAKYLKRGIGLYSDIAELASHKSRCVKTFYCPHMTRSTNDDGKLTWVFHRVNGHATNYVEMNTII